MRPIFPCAHAPANPGVCVWDDYRAGMIQLKRVYEAPSSRDGRRILVDRLWPRGLKKEAVALDDWLRDLAPSSELRKWFGHDPKKWPEFDKRYRAELKGKSATLDDLASKAKKGTLTLLFGAKDTEHNNAVVIAEVLRAKGGRLTAPLPRAAAKRAKKSR